MSIFSNKRRKERDVLKAIGEKLVGDLGVEKWLGSGEIPFWDSYCIFHNHVMARTPSPKFLMIQPPLDCRSKETMPIHWREVNFTPRCVPRFGVNWNPDGLDWKRDGK